MKNSDTIEHTTLTVANNAFFKEVKDILKNGNDVMFKINGNSMLPFLSHGDNVVVGKVTDKDLTLGKVMLGYSKFGYVLHRLVWKSGDKIWLAGDNNLIQIEYLEKNNVFGYVKFVEIDGVKKDINTRKNLLLGLFWFCLRPFRWIIYKFKKIFQTKI